MNEQKNKKHQAVYAFETFGKLMVRSSVQFFFLKSSKVDGHANMPSLRHMNLRPGCELTSIYGVEIRSSKKKVSSR